MNEEFCHPSHIPKSFLLLGSNQISEVYFHQLQYHWEHSFLRAVEEPITIGIMPAMKDFFDFYDLKLIEGELLSEKNAPNGSFPHTSLVR